jgi:hypothetical protein
LLKFKQKWSLKIIVSRDKVKQNLLKPFFLFRIQYLIQPIFFYTTYVQIWHTRWQWRQALKCVCHGATSLPQANRDPISAARTPHLVGVCWSFILAALALPCVRGQRTLEYCPLPYLRALVQLQRKITLHIDARRNLELALLASCNPSLMDWLN